MIGARPELGEEDPVVDALQHVGVDVFSVIDAAQVADEVFGLHLALGLDALVVQVSVEHDNGEGQQEDGVGTAELLHLVWVA